MDLKELAVLVDRYIQAREERRALEAQADKMKEELEQPLKAQILVALKESGAGSVGGTKYQAALVKKTTPQVTDWSALYAHIQKTGEFELLQRRLSPPAVKERWDEKEEVPGVSPIQMEDLSITKL